jgi:putative transposase
MSRPRRIQYPGALYHVTSRGNRRALIFLDDRDHLIWSDLLCAIVERFGFILHAYCMMPNHYHLVVETPQPNLSKGIHYLNSTYAQRFNKRHQLVGHVFQGRFYTVLIDQDAHLLELSRYLPLNPVRSGLVLNAEDWQWSSYRALAGLAPIPAWLESDWILSQFSSDASRQRRVFAHFVEAGRGMKNPLLCADEHTSLRSSTPLFLHQYENRYPNRDIAMAEAYRSNGYSMQEVAEHFGVSVKTVSRAARKHG